MTDVPASRPAGLRARTQALIALLAVAASAPSLLNGFAYDDHWIIATNARVHDLGRWLEWFAAPYWPTLQGALYRPLTTAAFALQWAAGEGAPIVFHAVSVALYAACAVAFARLAASLLPATAATAAGALFAVHPVHVEAVANVVGQSELTAGLLVLVALAHYIHLRQAGRMDDLALPVGALFLVAVLVKEHALLLPAMLLAAECTLFAREPVRTRLAGLAPVYVILAAVAALALAVRWDVLGSAAGDLPHPALDGLDARGRFLTMLGVYPDILRLLLWPVRLSADYSPAHVTVHAVPDFSQVSGLVAAAGVGILFGLAWKRSAVAAFGGLVALLAWLPTSNLLFGSGILLSERTLFLPSAGVLLAAGSIVARAVPLLRERRALRTIAGLAFAVVLVAGLVRSITRQRVWRSSEDVFFAMLQDAPMSYRSHYAWGGVLFDRGDLAGGERHWRMAIRILPTYPVLYQDLAHRYRERNLCGAAIPLYERALALQGNPRMARAGLVACQLRLAQFRAARATARLGVLDGNDAEWFRARLFSADSALAATDSVRR